MAHVRHRPLQLLGTLLLTLVPWHAAHAKLYNFEFTGATSFGNVLFDDEVPDTDRDPQKGRYIGAVRSYSITLNGTHQSETDQPTFETFTGSIGLVVLGIQSAHGIGGCGATIECLGFNLDTLHFPFQPGDDYRQLSFYYEVGTFANDSLPQSIDADAENFVILLTPTRQWFQNNPLTVITAVPEPEMGWLLALGAGLVLMRVRRGKAPSPHQV